MSREELVKAFSDKTNFTLENSATAVNAFMEVLSECLKAHEPLTFHGVFSLKPTIKAARRARNPRTGEVMMVPPKKGFRFLLSPQVKKVLEADRYK